MVQEELLVTGSPRTLPPPQQLTTKVGGCLHQLHLDHSWNASSPSPFQPLQLSDLQHPRDVLCQGRPHTTGLSQTPGSGQPHTGTPESWTQGGVQL